MEPVLHPLLTHLLVEQWVEESNVPKPTAFGTLLRYSGAHGCLRQMGYDAFDAQFSEPVKPASAWVMNLGSLIHEALQQRILARYPEAKVEFKSQAGDHVSGSADTFLELTFGDVLYELKTMGSFPFKKAMGYKGMFKNIKRDEPQGPSSGHVTQAGMNALGAEKESGKRIEWVVIGVVTYEPIRRDEADAMQISELDRFLGEFHYPREVWEPLALAELARLDEAAADIQAGYLPDRFAVNDEGQEVMLNLEQWQCDYCPHLTTCMRDGAGRVHQNDSVMVRRG